MKQPIAKPFDIANKAKTAIDTPVPASSAFSERTKPAVKARTAM